MLKLGHIEDSLLFLPVTLFTHVSEVNLKVPTLRINHVDINMIWDDEVISVLFFAIRKPAHDPIIKHDSSPANANTFKGEAEGFHLPLKH